MDREALQAKITALKEKIEKDTIKMHSYEAKLQKMDNQALLDCMKQWDVKNVEELNKRLKAYHEEHAAEE